jgi:hypothetical protein
MITNLPEWYRMLSIQNLSSEAFEKRSTAIKKILKNKDTEWLLNCVRLYIGKKTTDPNFYNELTGLFLDSDPLFPQKDNLIELRVLSGAILHDLVSSSKHKGKLTIALAIQSCMFGVPVKNIINSDIIIKLKTFLNEESIRLRECNESRNPLNLSFEPTVPDVTPATILANFTKITELFSKVETYVNERSDNNSKRIMILEEESNIHWWIFRSFSNILNKQINEIDYDLVPLIIGSDLSALTRILPGPVAYDQYLLKVLNGNFSNVDKEILLKDAINKLNKAKNDLFPRSYAEKVGNIGPLMMGLNLREQSGNDTGWVTMFESFTDINSNIKVLPIELAKQSFIESQLMKSFNQYH